MIDIEKFICSLLYRSSGFCVIKVIDIINALHSQGLEYKEGKIVRVTSQPEEQGKQSSADDAKTCKDEQNSALSEEDDAVLDALIQRLEGEDVYVSPHLAVECLKSLKERIQPKQEWSEEDERMLDEMYEFFDKYKVLSLKHGMDNYAKLIKFLKDRWAWKPSKEQIEMLHDAIVYVEGCNSNFKGSGSVLEKLYNDLKKLKG